MDEAETNERYEKWRKPTIACFVVFVISILYFFAYPFFIIKVVHGGYLNDIPDWLDTAMEWSVIPLDWIYDNVDWYKSLIDGWTGRI